MTFETDLRASVKGATKTVIVGIGNELNGDDGFGVHVAGELGSSGRIISIQAHTVPENFISKIAGEKPSHVIFIDAADLGAEPGTLELLSPGDLARVKTVTHRIPLARLIERLESMHGCRVLIIGMQPAGMAVGSGLSVKALGAARVLIDLLRHCMT